MKYVPIEDLFPFWFAARSLFESTIPKCLTFRVVDQNSVGLDFVWFDTLMEFVPPENNYMVRHLHTQLNGQVNMYLEQSELPSLLKVYLYEQMTPRTIAALNHEIYEHEQVRLSQRKHTLFDVINHVLGIRCCFEVQNPPKWKLAVQQYSEVDNV